MKRFEIPHRWRSEPVFVAQVVADDPTPMRTALCRAVAQGANLIAANLLAANLIGADLRGAYLTGAYLRDANLSAIRADFFAVLDAAPNEVAGLLLAVREGRIDGSHYSGECACLVGTIANIRHCDYDELTGIVPNSSRPSERLFMGISPGHIPAINQVAKIVEGWILEWQAERSQ